ncbi:MAG: site-specific DNA-methyltransferase, partial [Nostoc sp.]
QYLEACKLENNRVQAILKFVLLCVLESISYTRKDGQYLRWDYRSGRGQSKKPFNKGEILEFDNAITNKIIEILDDLLPYTQQIELFPIKNPQGQIHLYGGSCLKIMPHLSNAA